jgi:phosphatidylglycerophosphatase C
MTSRIGYIHRMPDDLLPTTQPGVALFDLDGTLTWHDTLQAFLGGYVGRRPGRWIRLWRIVPAALGFLATRDRGVLKSRVIRAVMAGDSRREISEWAGEYVAGLRTDGTFRPAALAVLERHRAAGHHLVLLSASPNLYVPEIGALLGFERVLCTEVAWRIDPTGGRLDGRLLTPNRRGEEKSVCLAWLRAQYPGLPVTAYGNSSSDLPHLKLADAAILVNGNRAARRAAAQAGVPTADWT